MSQCIILSFSLPLAQILHKRAQRHSFLVSLQAGVSCFTIPGLAQVTTSDFSVQIDTTQFIDAASIHVFCSIGPSFIDYCYFYVGFYLFSVWLIHH